MTSSNGFFFLDTLIQPNDTTVFLTCEDTSYVCLGVPFATINDYQIFNNGGVYASGITACDFDTVNVYGYELLTGQGSSGPYVLQSWRINGVLFTGTFNNITELVDSLNTWDVSGTWFDNTTDLQVQGGDPNNTYTDMVVYEVVPMNTRTLSQQSGVVANATQIMLTDNKNEIVVRQISTSRTDTFDLWMACVNPSTSSIDLVEGDSISTCIDLSELLTDVNHVEKVESPLNGAVDFTLMNNDSCLSIRAMTQGLDTAYVVVCDDLDVCDTAWYFASVRPPNGYHVEEVMVYVGESNTICYDMAAIGGSADTIYNICPANSGTYAVVSLDEDSFCLDINPTNAGGTDTACIVVCNMAVCDTTQYNIRVKRRGPEIVNRTVYINQMDSYCEFTLPNLTGSVDTFYNYCEPLTPQSVDFTLDLASMCVDYSGLSLGIDTACIVVLDDEGNADTTLLIVSTISPITDTISITLNFNDRVDLCLDTLELGAPVDTAFFCATPATSSILIDSNIVDLCVSVVANPVVGSDTVCLVVCDELMVCDTTIYFITVVDATLPEVEAEDDTGTTVRGNDITIDILANDNIPGDPADWTYFVVDPGLGGPGPNNGSYLDNFDGTVTYLPDTSFCGGVDSFIYVVCNGTTNCDTATVRITVNCTLDPDDLKVFNAFSPNNDGNNDCFFVEGIENLLNNTVHIYNRWGNLVYQAINYDNQNDCWDGTWKGDALPDGTYFYVIKGGNNTKLSGYVVIHR